MIKQPPTEDQLTLLNHFNHVDKLNNLSLKDIHIHSSSSEKNGIRLYQKNQLLRDIATFMEHPESYSFYKKYINKNNICAILSLLKMYDKISEILKNNFNAYHKIFLLYILLNHPIYSRIIFKKNHNPLSLSL